VPVSSLSSFFHAKTTGMPQVSNGGGSFFGTSVREN
jgi:hypothetical protein